MTVPSPVGTNVQVMVCTRSTLATSRRLVRARMREVAGDAALDRGYTSRVLIGLEEIDAFAALARETVDLPNSPFAHLPLLLSESHSLHRDADPAVMLIGSMPVTRSFVNDPNGAVEWVTV